MSDSFAASPIRNLHEDVLSTLEAFDAFAAPVAGAVLYSSRWRATSLPRNLRAASAASALGLTSLDDARRRYTHNDEEDEPTATDRYLQAYFAARRHMKETLSDLGNFEEGDNYGAFAAAVALQRLDSGFRGAHILYRLGLNIEGDTISRQILEQIAWALEASRLGTPEEMEKVSASYSISALKKLIPGIGPLYGALSEIAHAGLEQHRQHVELDPDDRGRIVVARGRLATSALILLRLADAWVAVCEYTQRDIVGTFRALASRDDLRLLQARPFLAESQRLVQQIEKLETEARAS
ncbi:hypothetical protein [uncultured Microbacterium sp.]|uniref:hypothetical protein n=1 Tax=uncultured Microbacterium sp. TaxID=191216 RepID=UPI0025D625FC|nr:hypothetical protein [uncultured Microbacterium sp.]